MEAFIGTILAFAGNFAPKGWLMCNGQLLSISQNAALFSILGTTYGGDGVTTFALPDLRGRAAINWGQAPGLSNYVLGEASGAESVTLTVDNLAKHTHGYNAVTVGGDQSSPTNNALAKNTANTYSANSPDTVMNSGVISAAGQNQPFSVMQPFLAITYIICTDGVYPSRP